MSKEPYCSYCIFEASKNVIFLPDYDLFGFRMTCCSRHLDIIGWFIHPENTKKCNDIIKFSKNSRKMLYTNFVLSFIRKSSICLFKLTGLPVLLLSFQ